MVSKARRRAFSLLELLAVVVILGVIAMVVIPRINFSSSTAKENSCFQNKAEINAVVERYTFEDGSLPSNMNGLDDPAYFPEGLPDCPISGENYTLFGGTKRVTATRPDRTDGSH